MFQVCTKCGTPALSVNREAVENKVVRPLEIPVAEKIYVCPNPDCNTVYFSKGINLTTDDVNEPVFFKDNSDNVPICYCSNLTRGEIKNAVGNGCKTINEVREFTGKNITGKCKEMNPLGQCCHNSFLYEIEQALGQKPFGLITVDKNKLSKS